METKEFDIDDIKYIMTPANAIRAWNALKKAGVLFRGIDVSAQENTKSNALGAILSNLGEPVVQDIENLVYEHTKVRINGEVFKLSAQTNEHFNQYRSHLIQVLVEGATYQFEDFFNGGMSSLNRLMPGNTTPTAAITQK